MKFKEYQVLASRTNSPLEGDLITNIHMIMGMTTEVGELVDVFKKKLAYQKPVDWVNAKEEVGDLMWYIANFCTINNLDMNEILQTNIDKLKARYPEQFTTDDAVNRNLFKERKILEDDRGL